MSIDALMTPSRMLQHGSHHTLLAVLSYNSDLPHAVCVMFISGDATVPWEFDRELLAAGMHAPTGDGDVRVFPWSASTIAIAITSHEGAALFELCADVVAEFLARTYALVPAGTEQLDVDAAIANILGATR